MTVTITVKKSIHIFVFTPHIFRMPLYAHYGRIIVFNAFHNAVETGSRYFQ